MGNEKTREDSTKSQEKERLVSAVKDAFEVADVVKTAIKKRADVKDSISENQIKLHKMDKDSILSSMDNTFSIDDAVQTKINDRIKTRMVNVANFTQKAEKAFANFLPSKVPASVRKETTYLGEGDNLGEAQKKIIEEDLKKVAKPVGKNGFMTMLSDQELQKIGLQKTAEGGISGTLNAEKLSKYINNRMSHTELMARTDFVTDCWAEKQAKKAIDEITGSSETQSESAPETPTSSDDTSSAETSDLTAEQMIKAATNTQMENATSPETALKYGIPSRPTDSEIGTATNALSLRGGPADVDAYHDFYDLQIAFQHIWTELFDKELAEKGKKLYAELVKLKKDLGVDSEIDSVSSTDQLKQLLSDLRNARMQIAGEDDRFKEVKKYLVPEITLEQWASLDSATKDTLYSLVPGWFVRAFSSDIVKQNKSQARSIIKTALAKIKKSRIESFLDELEEHLAEKHVFDVFAKDSMNFGILVNYRQKWSPLNYQVGELVSTIPLAPQESRKYSKKRIVKKTRAVKEIENSLQIRKEDSSDTYRDHAEIVKRATNKTNFQHTAEGGVNFAVWNAKAGHSITVDSAKQSSQSKKIFREAVLKAAREYRNENKLEVNTLAAEEYEEASSGEIKNPNDELPVTYLFYELQRRYEISEKIHSLTPVILVANEVPYPHEIDEGWLLTHDWILRRVILDDSFLTALDYLSEKFVGDEISTEVLRSNFESQMDVVGKVTQQVVSHTEALAQAREAMDQAIEEYAKTQVSDATGFFEAIGDFFTGGDDDPSGMLRIKMEAAKEAFQRAERQEKELRSRLETEISALQVATDKYAKALEDQFNRRTEILRLRAHVKDNILYYMQAIWDQEPPDQRFFRLYNLDVPDITIQPSFEADIGTGYIFTQGNKTPVSLKICLPGSVNVKTKKLVELADLDNLLGYKGNYMIFPLKENNSITLYMMQDYINLQEMARLWDPDELSNYTIEEMKELIKCYYEKYPNSFTSEVKAKYTDLFIKRLMDPYREKETVVVPTDSLYIEALPGKHPILEDFKLIHRAVDVKKVQSEVRHAELENVRLAARALKGEHEDPDIEKKIVIEGSTDNIDISPNP